MNNKKAQAIIDYVEARILEYHQHGDSIGDLRELTEKRRKKRDELLAAFADQSSGGAHDSVEGKSRA